MLADDNQSVAIVAQHIHGDVQKRQEQARIAHKTNLQLLKGVRQRLEEEWKTFTSLDLAEFGMNAQHYRQLRKTLDPEQLQYLKEELTRVHADYVTAIV